MAETLSPAEIIEQPSSSQPVPEFSRETHVPAWKRTVKKLVWTVFALFCLLTFTLLKLPEDRLQNFIQGTIAAQLSSQGVGMTAGRGSLSMGWGIRYTMKDLTLTFPPTQVQDPIKIEELSVSPSFLSLFSGKAGAALHLVNKGGSLEVDYLQSLFAGASEISFHATSLDLGALGILPLLASVKGSALFNGKGTISGTFSAPSDLGGKVDLALSKIVIDQQSIVGFQIPRLGVSEGKVDVSITQGKVTVKILQLGKTGNESDDIRGNVTGDVTLGKNPQFSTLNLRANFSLSQTILKSFILLDAILGAGKQPDGSYAFLITGPISSPNPQPVAAGH